MTRRNIELILLLIASPLVILMFAMLAINEGQALDMQTLGVPIGIFGAFVVAHIATRTLAPEADPAILPISFALSGIGIAFITRVAPFSDSPNMAINQVVWLFLGVVLMIAVMAFLRNPDRLANYKYTLAIVGVILLLSPMFPGIGQEIYGSRIWLHVGGFSFQPGEIAKIIIVLFLAGYLAQNREMLFVVFEKDLGSALVFFLVFLVMLYVATGKKFYLVIGLGLVAIGGVGAYFAFDHVQTRVATWLNPFADAQNTGYQLVQTIYSLADGDLFGTGIGRGMAGGGNGITRIPVVESDFIFAAIGEETGLLGAAGLLLLYLCFAIRGFVTAARAKSDVSSLIGAGLTSIIVLQAFIIVGGVTRLIPLTGITLPFVSQGGSSLLAAFIIVGFLLRCGDEGTGSSSEIMNTTTIISANSVLGRVSLGKRLTHTMIVFSLMFAALVANLTLIMVVQASDYQNMAANNHTMARESKTERGTISTYDGTILAQSVKNDDGTYSRVYPAGDLASHVVGYTSSKYGTSGIEASYNDTLKGEKNFASITDVVNSLSGVGTPGNDVTLSINSQIQQAAQDALANDSGACVVMDPKTGAVLAMASAPTYDAGDIDQVIADAANSGANSTSSSELYNRATQALYAPGSTFKIISLACALQEGIATESTMFESPSSMDIGNAAVTNFEKHDYGTISLARATELSSNVVFGQLGVQIGAENLVNYAKLFGFNMDIDFDLPLATSVMPDAKDMTTWETAWAAAGEPVGESKTANHPSPAGPQATVLEMALAGCGIANDGAIMQPYLVDGIYNADGKRSYTATPKKLSQAVSADTASRVRTVLEGVVNNGTGTSAQISGVTVAGKTGTAEHDGYNDVWFVGMAPSENCNVVVAIVIEKGQSSEYAASKARDVMKTALEVQGDL